MYLTLKVRQEKVLPAEDAKDSMRALVRRVCSELHVEWLDLVLLHAPDLRSTYTYTEDGAVASINTDAAKKARARWWQMWNQLEQLNEWVPLPAAITIINTTMLYKYSRLLYTTY